MSKSKPKALPKAPIFMADQAWEQFERNGRGVQVTFSNYDAVRTAFMAGYIQANTTIGEANESEV
jgi:hypothetical protein